MSEFIGRTGSKRAFSYPENTRAAAASIFARNSAFGPTDPQIVAGGPGGTQILWDTIESLGVGGADVPITPRATNIVHLTGEVTLENASSDPVNVKLNVQVGGVDTPVPFNETVSVPGSFTENGGFIQVPIDVTFTLPGALGTTHNIEINLTALTGAPSAVSIVADSSSLNIQEISPVTG